MGFHRQEGLAKAAEKPLPVPLFVGGEVGFPEVIETPGRADPCGERRSVIVVAELLQDEDQIFAPAEARSAEAGGFPPGSFFNGFFGEKDLFSDLLPRKKMVPWLGARGGFPGTSASH